jgi:hypothetical protein
MKVVDTVLKVKRKPATSPAEPTLTNIGTTTTYPLLLYCGRTLALNDNGIMSQMNQLGGINSKRRHILRFIDLINKIDEISDDQVIYIMNNDPITEISEVITYSIKDVVDNKIDMHEMKYLLEVSLEKEVIEVWINWRNGKRPSNQEKIQAILYYVDHDAYIPDRN